MDNEGLNPKCREDGFTFSFSTQSKFHRFSSPPITTSIYFVFIIFPSAPNQSLTDFPHHFNLLRIYHFSLPPDMIVHSTIDIPKFFDVILIGSVYVHRTEMSLAPKKVIKSAVSFLWERLRKLTKYHPIPHTHHSHTSGEINLCIP